MAIALALWATLSALQDPPTENPYQEKVLAVAPAGAAIKAFSVAPVTGRLAFVAKVGGSDVVFVDGKEAARSPEIYPVHWSSDGNRWACIVKEGEQRLVVADGVRGDPAPRVGEILFSPDGRRLAYVSGGRGKQAAVVDGVRQKEYEEVEHPAFSGNGARFGYIARNGEASLVVVDGVESAPAPQSLISHLRFSPDGKSVAYVRQSQAGAFLILDDRSSKRYSQVGLPVFSPVGSRLAYEAEVDGKKILVVDGKEVEAAESGSGMRDAVCFSPDGQRVAWRVEPNGKDPYIVIDGRRQDALSSAHFPMTFSPDGKRLAYVGREGGTLIGVVDGKPIRVGEVALSPVQFSPDGRRTAFVTRDRNFRQFVVVDGKPGAPHDEVRDPVFSPDGSKLVYVARTGGEFRRRVFAEAAAPAEPAPKPAPAVAPATADPVPAGFRARIGSARLFHIQYGKGTLAFSSDGKRVGATGMQGVRIWEVDDGREVRTFPGKGAETFAFSPDGRRVALGGRDKAATIWDVETGRALHVLGGHSNYLTALAFSPDSKQLLTAPYGPDLRVWDVATGKEVFQLPRHGESVPIAVFSGDGKSIFTVPVLKKSVFAWNAADGTAIREIPGVAGALFKTWISPRGQYVAGTKQDFPDRRFSIVISDLATGKQVSTFDIGQEDAEDIAWSGDDRLLAVAARTEVALRERETGRILVAFPVSNAREIDVSPDGKMVATSNLGFVRLWDVATGKERSLDRHAAGITSTVYSGDGQTIATAAADGTVRLWSVPGGKSIASLEEHSSASYRPAFLAGGKQLATIDGKKGLRVWDATNGKELRTLPIKFPSGAEMVSARVLALSPDGQKAAVYDSSPGQALLIVDLQTGKTQAEGTSKGLLNERTLESHWRFTYSADGKTIVSGGSGATVVAWNAETARPAFKFDAGARVLSGPVLSPDGTKIVTGGEDGTVKSWDVATGRPAGALQAHKTGVTALAFSPDGSILATWGWDRVLRFWNWTTGKELGAPTPIFDQINSMAFSPDGKDLAVGGQDGTILFKDVPAAGGK